MDAYWQRRYVVALLLALTLALAAGMVGWGALPLPAQTPRANAAEGPGSLAIVVACLAIVPLGLWGAFALQRSSWPAEMSRPLRVFFMVCMPAGLAAVGYHAWGSTAAFVIGHGLMAAAHLLLLATVLAERLDPRFGSNRACSAIAAMAVTGVAYAFWAASAHGGIDLRPLRLMQAMPALLVPAGALSLGATHLGRRDWLMVFALFVLSAACDAFDAHTVKHLGWSAGHALSHACLSAATAWLAYRAAVSSVARGPLPAAVLHSESRISQLTRS